MSTTQINLHYIRAAILANTGVDLGFDEIKKLLVEENLITQSQPSKIKILKNYSEYYDDYTIGKSSSSGGSSNEEK